MWHHELCNADPPYRRHTPLCTSRTTTEDVFHHISDILKLFVERLLEVRLFKETCVWLCCPWLKYGLLLFPYLWAALHAGMCVWKYCYVISLWSSLMVEHDLEILGVDSCSEGRLNTSTVRQTDGGSITHGLLNVLAWGLSDSQHSQRCLWVVCFMWTWIWRNYQHMMNILMMQMRDCL